ncbi:hypothetical protein QUB19_20970 [Microcoleus sp. B4-C5]|uniref:hypothetical protein n=1 Tax=unclassified Microcoleus TaxID=2642155 RepID=UPI002FCF23C8
MFPKRKVIIENLRSPVSEACSYSIANSPQNTNTSAVQLSHHPASTNLLTPCFAIT